MNIKQEAARIFTEHTGVEVMSHTKDQLTLVDQFSVQWGSGRFSLQHTGVTGTVKEREANARRIVACVNACAGVTNKTLEACDDWAGLLKTNAQLEQRLSDQAKRIAVLEGALADMVESYEFEASSENPALLKAKQALQGAVK